MTLIITNGDSAVSRIEKFALADTTIAWQDVLHDGPVRPHSSLEAQSKERAQFISKFAKEDLDDTLRLFAERDKILHKAGSYTRIELWFEHDLYDQLQLLQILDFAHRIMPHQDFHLVQSNDYLCGVSDEVFLSLPQKATLVSKEEKACASKVLEAFTHSTPELLIKLLGSSCKLPYVTTVIQRLLMEYPDKNHGLPTSLYRSLTPLLSGSCNIGGLFQYMQSYEEAKFMGDLSYSHFVDEIACAKHPLISGQSAPYCHSSDYSHRDPLEYRDYFMQSVMLTEFGQQVIAKEANHVNANGIDRWIGGVHLKTDNVFFYDADQKCVLL